MQIFLPRRHHHHHHHHRRHHPSFPFRNICHTISAPSPLPLLLLISISPTLPFPPFIPLYPGASSSTPCVSPYPSTPIPAIPLARAPSLSRFSPTRREKGSSSLARTTETRRSGRVRVCQRRVAVDRRHRRRRARRRRINRQESVRTTVYRGQIRVSRVPRERDTIGWQEGYTMNVPRARDSPTR